MGNFLVWVIWFVAAENTADNRVSAGERYARIYEINLSRCIFCGYCELACPSPPGSSTMSNGSTGATGVVRLGCIGSSSMSFV